MITIEEFEAAKTQRDEAQRTIERFAEQTESLPTKADEPVPPSTEESGVNPDYLDLIRERDTLRATLREVDGCLRAAWANGNLPASVIPTELAQRCAALLKP